MHRDFDGNYRVLWLRTVFNNPTFAGNGRYLSPDLFIELCLAMSASDPMPALEVRRRHIGFGTGGTVDAARPVVAFARDAMHPGFLSLPTAILAHSWMRLQSHAYEICMDVAGTPLPVDISVNDVQPRGPMVDARYDQGGLVPEIVSQVPFSFMPARNIAQPPANGSGE
jgi:hypothetical protein